MLYMTLLEYKLTCFFLFFFLQIEAGGQIKSRFQIMAGALITVSPSTHNQGIM